MPLTPQEIAAGGAAARLGAEIAFPVLAPFDPLIGMLLTATIAHFTTTKTWPTIEQIKSYLPADYAGLVGDWAAYKPSGDGTLRPVVSGT